MTAWGSAWNPLIRAGMMFLVLASLSKWLLHPTGAVGKEVADGTTGLLYGLSIGCSLLGLWKSVRANRTAPPKGPAEPPAQA